MMVMASAIDATIRTGTKKSSAAKPITTARKGSAAAARPTRATGARATISISAINTASTDTRARVPARLSQWRNVAEAAEREPRKPRRREARPLAKRDVVDAADLPRAGVARQLAANQHDFAAHVGGRAEVKVAADHDDAVADASFDGQRAEDDDRGIGHLLVALDAHVLPDCDAGAGQFVRGDIRGGFRGLSEHGNGSDETGQDECQQRSAHRYPTLHLTDESGGRMFPSTPLRAGR